MKHGFFNSLLMGTLAFGTAFLAGCDDDDPIPRIDPGRIIEEPAVELPEHLRDRLRDLLFGEPFTAEDAGDYSFVRQIMPILFGRKVRGYDELKVLVDLIRRTSRPEFLAILLDQESPYFSEYLDHWSEVLVDRVRLHRESEKTMDTCFRPKDPPRVPDHLRGASALASCVKAVSAGDDCSSGVDFNMSDVLRSALALDDLAPFYRAYLFAMVAHPIGGAEVTAQNQQADLGATFTHVYTHRSQDCLGCHNTAASVSGVRDINDELSYWNRHHPVPGKFELALFGTAAGRDPRETHSMLRSDISQGGTIRPWGWTALCGTFNPAGTPVSGEPVMVGCTDAEAGIPCQQVEAYFTRPLGEDGSVWELDNIFYTGVQSLASHGLRRSELRLPAEIPDPTCTDHCADLSVVDSISTPPPGALSTLIDDSCDGCHNSSNVLDLRNNWQENLASELARTGFCDASRGYRYRAVPGDTGASCIIDVLESCAMPLSGPCLTEAEIDLFRDWINGLPATAGCPVGAESVCELIPESNDNDAAFAYLVAMNIVNQTWEEVMGNPATIANYFPRNVDARDVMWNLAEHTFIPHGWSLKALLIEILTSEYFNRRPPVDSALTSAYTMPTVPKPFEVNDPRRPPEALDGWTPGGSAPLIDMAHVADHMDNEPGRSRHLNAMSDQIYRYAAENLLRSVHEALDWPAVPRLRSGLGYPSDELRKNIGQFYHDAEPGFRNVDFQGLLAWESAHGSCQKPDPQPGVPEEDDWIDTLVDEAASFPGTLSHRDLARTVRDWLIANGEIRATVPAGEARSEEAVLNSLFGGSDSVPVLDNAADLATIEAPLRTYCGALVESPQFLLAGIADMGLGPKPELRVCNEEPCRYVDICQGMREAVEERSGGRMLSCWSDGLDIDWPFGIPPDHPAFCPELICRQWPGALIDVLPGCLQDPIGCLPEPPQCDLGCATIDCCGGPGPPIDLDAWYWLGAAEGGLVELAENIQVLRRYGDKPETLEQGDRLRFGDWLVMPPGSHLRLVTEAGVFQSPAKGVPKGVNDAGWRMLVTGETAVLMRDKARAGRAVPREYINRTLTHPSLMGGAAGPPALPSKIKVQDPARYRQRLSDQPQQAPEGGN